MSGKIPEGTDLSNDLDLCDLRYTEDDENSPSGSSVVYSVGALSVCGPSRWTVPDEDGGGTVNRDTTTSDSPSGLG